MCEAGRGRRYVGNARESRLEGETLEGLLIASGCCGLECSECSNACVA